MRCDVYMPLPISIQSPQMGAPTNEGIPQCQQSRYRHARDAILALSTSSRLQKNSERARLAGKARRAGMARSEVRSSENLLRWKRWAQKSVRSSWPITKRSSSSFIIRSVTNRFLAVRLLLGQRHFRRRLPIRGGPYYQPGRPGCDPPSLHRSDDGFCHAGQGG